MTSEPVVDASVAVARHDVGLDQFRLTPLDGVWWLRSTRRGTEPPSDTAELHRRGVRVSRQFAGVGCIDPPASRTGGNGELVELLVVPAGHPPRDLAARDGPGRHMPKPLLPGPPPVRTQEAGEDSQMNGPAKVIRGPRLRAIIGHLMLSLLTASVIPGVLFYLCLVNGSVWMALVAALAWCYGAITWRMATRRRASGLLLLTAVGLTLRTAVAFASGDAYLYLLQPVINNAVVAALFLASLATARPVVARLAADFYPMNADVANRARVQRLFWNLTLLWAMVCLAKSLVTLWLLQSQSVETFVAVKSVLLLAITVAATAATLSSAVWVARKEGLLTPKTGRGRVCCNSG